MNGKNFQSRFFHSIRSRKVCKRMNDLIDIIILEIGSPTSWFVENCDRFPTRNDWQSEIGSERNIKPGKESPIHQAQIQSPLTRSYPLKYETFFPFKTWQSRLETERHSCRSFFLKSAD